MTFGVRLGDLASEQFSKGGALCEYGYYGTVKKSTEASCER